MAYDFLGLTNDVNRRLNEVELTSSTFSSANNNIEIIFPKLAYCTDNAAMIAMAGYHKIINGQKSEYSLIPNPSLKL